MEGQMDLFSFIGNIEENDIPGTDMISNNPPSLTNITDKYEQEIKGILKSHFYLMEVVFLHL